MNTKSIVKIIVALIVGLVMIPILISLVNSSTLSQTTHQTLNSTFADNDTPYRPTYWDNAVNNQATDNWNSAGYVDVESIDNSTTNVDNGTWYQSVTFSAGYDELISAVSTFNFRVIDNDNAQSIVVRATLWNGTDNTVLFYENVTALKSSSWTTVENDIGSHITGAGTYTLYIDAEMNGKGPGTNLIGNKPNLFVGFDDASLTIVTASQSTYPLLYMIPLLFVIALVLGVIVWATREHE